MKKVKLFLAASVMSVLAALPTTAFCDTVDDISEEFGYQYRWTVEAELDSTYENYWINDVAENGKIKISYIQTETPVATMRESASGVIVLQGANEMVLGCRMTNSTNGFQIAAELVNEDGEWKVNTNSIYDGSLRIFIYADGDNKVDNRHLMMYIGDPNSSGRVPTTPIILDESGMDQVEDTELLLAERTGFYHKSRYGRTPDMLSPNGGAIPARPVIRENAKKPIIENDVFTDDITENEEKVDVIPEFDVTLQEVQSAVQNNWVDNNVIGDINYGVEVLNGKHLTRYVKSVADGKMSFNISVPRQEVAEISSDGSISVKVQRFDRYRTSIAEGDLIFVPYTVVNFNDNVHIVSLKGDLGEKIYCLNNDTKKTAEVDGKYYMTAAICPVYEMTEDIVVYEYKNKTEEKDSEGDNIWKIINTPEIYLEYSDRSYCGIKKIGLKYGETVYAFDSNNAKIDFDVEVDLSDKIVGTDAAKKLVSEERKERKVNNEIENTLSDKDVSINMNVEPKPAEQEKEDEQIPQDSNVIKVVMNDKLLEFADQEPIIVNDRVLVPLRVIFEELGANVGWDGETQTVTMEKNETVVSLKIGAAELIKDGTAVDLDVAAQIQNERTLVPIRAITESFGNTVTWDGNNKIVEIK